MVGLASYPSSGNTWLRCTTIFLCILLVGLEETIYYSLNSRYLLEGVTGHYTGSMYNDISLRKKGFYGEGVPADAGIVVTVKTHGHTTGKGAHEERPAQVSFLQEFELFLQIFYFRLPSTTTQR